MMEDTPAMRLFLSIPVPDSFQNAYNEYRTQINNNAIRWTPPENLHVTVFFIGDTPESILPALIQKIEKVAERVQPFTLSYNKTIVVPPHTYRASWPTSMLWSTFDNSSRTFEHLAIHVREALEEMNEQAGKVIFDLGVQKRPLPHITLARSKTPIEMETPPQLSLPNEQLHVDHIELMQSVLDTGGSTFKKMCSFRLKQ